MMFRMKSLLRPHRRDSDNAEMLRSWRIFFSPTASGDGTLSAIGGLGRRPRRCGGFLGGASVSMYEYIAVCTAARQTPGMSTRQYVLGKIDTYLAETGTAPWALGQAAVRASGVVGRIRRGLSVTLHTVEAIEECMRQHPGGIRMNRRGEIQAIDR